MKQEQCYYCGQVATTREHVPPKHMFKRFDCDSITVPSCETHNCSKGGQDQAIIAAFLMPFKNKKTIDPNNNSYFSKDILLSIDANINSFERTKHRIKGQQIVDLPSDYLHNLPELPFIKKPISLKNWIRNLTAGIVYDGLKYFDTKVKWEEINVWSPDFISCNRNEKKKIDDLSRVLIWNNEFKDWINSFKWYAGWSAHPNEYPYSIYYFHLQFSKEEITIKHRFYQNYTWYAWFKPSDNTIDILYNKVKDNIVG